MAPWLYLTGALAASLPIALHWLGRGRAPRQVLPTFALLPMGVANPRRRRALVRPGLLALRLAVIACAVWFFCAAAPSHSAAVAVPAAPPVRLVVVLDASASMAQPAGARSAWQQAQALAQQRLATLPLGSLAALVVADGHDRPQQDLPLGADKDALQQAIAQTRCGQSSELHSALARARAQLPAPARPSDEIAVYTDDAAHAFLGRPLPAQIQGVAVQVHDVLAGAAQQHKSGNVAITALRVRPHDNSGAAIRIQIDNFSAQPATGVLGLWQGELPLQQLRLEMAPTSQKCMDARVPMPADAQLLQAKLHVDAGANALAGDDMRAVWLQPQTQAQLLAIGEVPQNRDDALYFLDRALQRAPADDVPISLQIRGAAKAATTLQQNKADAVLLSYAGHMPETLQQALAARLQSGAGLLLPLGAACAHQEGAAMEPFMGCKLRDAQSAAASARGQRVGYVDWQHPIFANFGAQGRSSLQQARVYRYAQLEAKKEACGHVLMALEDGSPLLVESTLPSGARRMLWTSGFTLADSDLPLHSVFVPLVQRLAAHTMGVAAHSRQAVDVGTHVPAAPDKAQLWSWRHAQARAAERLLASETTAEAEQFAHTGLWHAEIQSGGSWEPRPDHDIWVNAAASEANLAHLTDARATSAAPTGPANAPLSAESGRASQPPYSAVLLCILLMGEGLLASSSPKNAARVGVVPKFSKRFLRLRPALWVLRRTRVI